MMLKSLVYCALIATSYTNATTSPYYLGASGGWLDANNACEPHRTQCDNDTLAAKLFAGYTVTDWLALEAGYHYFGTIKADYPALEDASKNAHYQGRIQGVELSAKPFVKDNGQASLFGKIGALGWYTDVTGDELSYQHHASSTGISLTLGMGVAYQLTDTLSAQAEYQWFNNIGRSDSGGTDLNLLSLGITYRL